MHPKKQDIIEVIQSIAPEKYALPDDRTGIQVGSTQGTVSTCLVTLDVDMEVINKGIQVGAELIISHHPLFMSSLNTLSEKDIGQVALKALKHDITLYSAHTNLDAAPDVGVNPALAQALELNLIRPTHLMTTYREQYYKFVVFVPETHLSQVRDALTGAGAGWIGEYSHCTFASAGEGNFKPGTASQPFVGAPYELAKVSEYRLETIVYQDQLSNLINRLLEVHPYEAPAYEAFPLNYPRKEVGIGLVGELGQPYSSEKLLTIVEEKLRTQVRLAGEKPPKINKIALCGGSGGKLIPNAAAAGADVFVTGDIKYHDALHAYDQGLLVVDAGHKATELPVLDSLTKALEDQLSKKHDVNILPFYSQKNVFYR